MKTAYISCPMTVDQTVLDEVITLVSNEHVSPRWWSKGTKYDESVYTAIIKSSDAFIVILPEMAWSCKGDKMTSGSRKELAKAIHFKKPVYVAYKNRNDGLGIYASQVSTSSNHDNVNHISNIAIVEVSGIASTRYNFKDSFGGDIATKSETTQPKTFLENIRDGYADEFIKRDAELMERAIWGATKISHRHGRTWEQIREEMEKAGFAVPYTKDSLEDIALKKVINSVSEYDKRLLLFF